MSNQSKKAARNKLMVRIICLAVIVAMVGAIIIGALVR